LGWGVLEEFQTARLAFGTISVLKDALSHLQVNISFFRWTKLQEKVAVFGDPRCSNNREVVKSLEYHKDNPVC
jgi:hypothetical protein